MLTQVQEISLNLGEIESIKGFIDQIFNDAEEIILDDFLEESFVLSHQLPERLRRELYKFKSQESVPGILIRHSEKLFNIPRTPTSLLTTHVNTLVKEEALHILYASIIGEIFAWDSIQNGNIVNHILPIKAHERAPISSGSANTFQLHTEDAFHDYAGEFFSLMCNRNRQRVPTVIAFLGDVEIPDEVKEILFQPLFIIPVNMAHDAEQPIQRRPILFGSKEAPYFRINLNLQSENLVDEIAKEALEIFIAKLQEVKQSIILQEGDVLILDNFRVAHERPPYHPTYDGTDRWLKRLYITLNLRQSRELRDSAFSRVIRTKRER